MSLSINPDLTGLQEPSRVHQLWDVALTYSFTLPPRAPQVSSEDAEVLTVSGSLTPVARSAQDGLAVVQTADNTFGDVAALLRRMDLIAALCGPTTDLSPVAQNALQSKFDELQVEVHRLQSSAHWKGIDVLAGRGLTFREGPASDDNLTLDATTLTPVDVSQASVADASTVQNAIDAVDSKRADLATAKDRLIDGLHATGTAEQTSALPYAAQTEEPGGGVSLLL